MKILVIGGGAREHCICWKLLQNPKVEKIFVAPGNAFDLLEKKVDKIHLKSIDELLTFAKDQQIDLTIVGSEELLVAGIVDQFEANGLAIFGANKKAAMLEGSKAFAKEFMAKYGVKTAASKSFTDIQQAKAYVKTMALPIVVKASGLAAGKGVVICESLREAEETLNDIMVNKIFAEAGDTVVLEEFLQGMEISILSLSDGETILPLISARDHKKIGEGNQGLNTGGMGVIAPNPDFNEAVRQDFEQNILQPTLQGLVAEGMKFNGVIFFGLMLTAKGVYLLEYNMRLGDPETQAVLPLLENDLLEVILAMQGGKLAQQRLTFKPQSSCVVVLSAEGYPQQPRKGDLIKGIEQLHQQSQEGKGLIFLAGVKAENQHFITNGGRVLNLVGFGDNNESAIADVYQRIDDIQFDGKYYRKDIGKS